MGWGEEVGKDGASADVRVRGKREVKNGSGFLIGAPETMVLT